MTSMTSTAETYRAYSGPALFSMGFRPFFLFAALWAAFAVPIWVAAFAGWLPAEHFDRNWHAHEMLFGYLSGVIAGFLLTAVPNWTGRLPVAGAPLAGLVLLWCAGRVAMLVPEFAAAPFIDAAFLFVFAAVIGREIIAGRNVRNIKGAGASVDIGVANVLSHAPAASVDPDLATARRAHRRRRRRDARGADRRADCAELHAQLDGQAQTSRPSPLHPIALRHQSTLIGQRGLALVHVGHFAASLTHRGPRMLTLAGALQLCAARRAGAAGAPAVEPLVLVLHARLLVAGVGALPERSGRRCPIGVVPAASGLHAHHRRRLSAS
jgi:uncharacterized protein involved in response to NO